MLPIMLNLTGKLAVVVGGGTVGQRKIKHLLEQSVEVRLIEPRLGHFPIQHNLLQLIPDVYRDVHLTNAFFVVAAATADVNVQVIADARRHKILVCDAAIPERGDFHFPATLRTGELTFSLSTQGAAPALVARIRDQLRQTYDERFDQWVRTLRQLRVIIRERVPDQAVRKRLLRDFADWPWLAKIRESGVEQVLQEMLQIIEQEAEPL